MGTAEAQWVLPVVGALVVVFIALEYASTAGRDRAIAERESWRRGCSVPQNEPCVDVLKSGVVVGTGFIIVESKDALAFFDAAANAVRQLDKRGADITLRPHRKE